MPMYSTLARWWPLLSAPADYAEEAQSFLQMIGRPAGHPLPTLLELGSGGGNLASHLRAHFQLTLTDRSPQMLEVSRALNPDVEHIEGDMRELNLNRLFDVVLIHDAVMYCTRPVDVQAALRTAVLHCRDGGTVVVAPDCVRETFAAATSTGGEDAPDGRALRYLEWVFDPDPSDSTFETAFAIVTREANGEMRVELDRHVEGVFPEADWLAWFDAAGLATRVVRDAWDRHVFVGVKRAAASTV